jgi:hypothetical protein
LFDDVYYTAASLLQAAYILPLAIRPAQGYRPLVASSRSGDCCNLLQQSSDKNLKKIGNLALGDYQFLIINFANPNFSI